MNQENKIRRVFSPSTTMGLILAFTLGWSGRVVISKHDEPSLPSMIPVARPTERSVQAGPQTAGLQEPGAAKVALSATADTVMSFDQMKETLNTLTTAYARERFLWQYIGANGKFDTENAISLIRELPVGDMRESAALALLGLWTGRSSSQMAKRMDTLGSEGQLIFHMLAGGQASPEQAGALAKEFLRGSQRTEVLCEAANSLVATDPNAAFALGSDLVGNQQNKFLQRFARGWGQSDPVSALKWADEIPDEQTRAHLRGAIFASSASRDPVAAARFALTLPTLDSEKTFALEKAVGAWVGSDTESAQRWVQQLTEPADREVAKRAIQQHSIVGVGVSFREDPDGVIINELLPGGTAQLSGAIKKGDIILDISNGDGGWVNVRVVEKEEILGLIRGAPQSYVSLRIKSPTDATPRTVTLERRQIMLRPDQQ